MLYICLTLSKGIVELEQRVQTTNPVIIAVPSASTAHYRRYTANPVSRSRRACGSDFFAYNPDLHAGFETFLTSHAIDRNLDFFSTVDLVDAERDGGVCW